MRGGVGAAGVVCRSVVGSWPVFRACVAGSDLLRCSDWAATWGLSSHRCVYCATHDGRVISAAPDVTQPGRRVELCGVCGSYTKVIDAASPTPFPLTAIEDLATMDLDQGAMARGYYRPDLFDLDAIDPPTTPTCG